MNLLLLKLLRGIGLCLAFAFPKAGPDDEPADTPAPEDVADTSAGDDIPADDDPDPEEDDIPEDPALSVSPSPAPAPRASRSQAAIAELRRRTQEAERIAREAQEAVRRSQAGPSADERLMQEEETRLRDPNISDQERWQIQSNRVIRQSQQQAQQALMQSKDMADQNLYLNKARSNPTYEKYMDRVEKVVAEQRARGMLIPREVVLAQEIGRDVIAGNFKSKAGSPAPVLRGKPNAARSDTPRSGSMTERQRRVARLEDKPI